jgi:hypothetical protein
MSVSFDMRAVLESKRRMRERLAAAPIEEKLSMLERLRERTLAILASRADAAEHRVEDSGSKRSR